MIPLTQSEGLTIRNDSGRNTWSPPALLLEAAGDDVGLIGELIEAFSKDTDARIGQMRQALAASNFPRTRAEAHAIKGSAGQMGADAVAEACRELELVCDQQGALLIPARLDRVQELFAVIREAMAAYSNSERPESPVRP